MVAFRRGYQGRDRAGTDRCRSARHRRLRGALRAALADHRQYRRECNLGGVRRRRTGAVGYQRQGLRHAALQAAWRRSAQGHSVFGVFRLSSRTGRGGRRDDARRDRRLLPEDARAAWLDDLRRQADHGRSRTRDPDGADAARGARREGTDQARFQHAVVADHGALGAARDRAVQHPQLRGSGRQLRGDGGAAPAFAHSVLHAYPGSQTGGRLARRITSSAISQPSADCRRP